MLLSTMLAMVFILVFVHGTHTSEVSDIGDQFFNFRLSESPEYSSRYQFAIGQSDVEEWNEEAFTRRLNSSKVLLARAKDLLENRRYSGTQEHLDLQVLIANLNAYITGNKYRRFTAGFNADLIRNMKRYLTWAAVNSVAKLHHWQAKVINYSQLINELLVTMPESVDNGYPLPCVLSRDYLNILQGRVSSDITSFFAFKPWMNLNISESRSGVEACQSLNSSLASWYTQLQGDMDKGRCRQTNGASNLPGGADYYREALKWHTSGDMTPEKAHELGLEEVERITGEMKKITASEGYTTIKEYKSYLLSQPDESFSSEEDFLRYCRHVLADMIKPAMSRLFDFNITQPVEVVNDPYGSLGFYSGPSRDGTRPGRFIVDARDYNERLKVTTIPLVLHETLPGHHLQAVYLSEMAKISDFRRFIEYRHYKQVPFNWPFFTAWSEGWGLYSEDLGEEMGIIKTDRQRFGKLSMESLRAVRLVVDTGLHYYNWSMDAAVNYIVENTDLSEGQASGQVVRYIRWPGQACAYKIGQLKLKELRKTAEDKLGDDFDVKQFHNTILDTGPSPLSVVEQQVNNWIEETLVSSAVRPTYTVVLTTVASLLTLHLLIQY